MEAQTVSDLLDGEDPADVSLIEFARRVAAGLLLSAQDEVEHFTKLEAALSKMVEDETGEVREDPPAPEDPQPAYTRLLRTGTIHAILKVRRQGDVETMCGYVFNDAEREDLTILSQDDLDAICGRCRSIVEFWF